jgi:hypothetical protein
MADRRAVVSALGITQMAWERTYQVTVSIYKLTTLRARENGGSFETFSLWRPSLCREGSIENAG